LCVIDVFDRTAYTEENCKFGNSVQKFIKLYTIPLMYFFYWPEDDPLMSKHVAKMKGITLAGCGYGTLFLLLYLRSSTVDV